MYRNKKLGYRLWKEGCVKKVFAKANVRSGDVTRYLVTARIHASMKNRFYTVYIDLDQENGEVLHGKCNWKAGQTGCCNYTAALLYTLLDYSNKDIRVMANINNPYHGISA